MKPWLWLPAKWSHTLAPTLLPLMSWCGSQSPTRWRPFSWKGLEFANPLGLAGGVDKDGRQLLNWQRLGAGFLEVGTITPRPQGPNPGRIMDRDTRTLSVWNKMGFPNPGAENVQKVLESIHSEIKVPLFINIGKNRDTDNSAAMSDYVKAYQILKNSSQTFVINISSPNTKGLRDLQSKSALQELLKSLRNEIGDKNLLLKLSPDLSDDQLKECLDIGLKENMDGFILTNTTLQRPCDLPYSPQEGGVSGIPLKDLSRHSLKVSLNHLGDDRKQKLIISVGGIMDANEIQWRLDQGANLVQVYSALIYSGPFFFRKMARQTWH